MNIQCRNSSDNEPIQERSDALLRQLKILKWVVIITMTIAVLIVIKKYS